MIMSAQPQEKLSTADVVSAGPSPSGTEQAGSIDEAPSNVRRIDRPTSSGERPSVLLADEEAATLRRRWETIQIGFVDEPRRAVEDADSLVAQAMKRVAEVFADERGQLERQWSEGQNVSTEDLRVALTRYRSFFDRLLSV
jgi:hypothetical protein